MHLRAQAPPAARRRSLSKTARLQLRNADVLPHAWLLAILGIGLGAATALVPEYAAILLGGLALAAIASWRPVFPVVFGLLILAVAWSRLFAPSSLVAQEGSEKLLLYACLLPAAYIRGLSWQRGLPVLAYGLVAVLAALVGTPLPGLTTGQTLSSLATLCIGWVFFATRWDWTTDRIIAKALAWMPLASVAIGAVLQLAHRLSLASGSSPPRLEGASLAAWLAALSLAGVAACLVLRRRDRWPLAPRLAVINTAILAATLTRGALIALAVMSLPTAGRFANHQLRHRGTGSATRIAAASLAVVAVLSVLVPYIAARNANAVSYSATSGSESDISSGRFTAWAVAYSYAKANLAFGRGIGAGPVVGSEPNSPQGFLAQHDEYVRMLLEVGVVGGLILLSAMGAALRRAFKEAPLQIRADIAAMALALATYSVTDNTLSAVNIAVPLLLVISLASSPGRSLHVLS
ncbi:MAG: O-antigen ligase family protein [Solirubrobacteraceae bacterium]|jgi:hypothetical protein